MATCLVVDDSAVIRKVAKRILDTMKVDVIEAEDGPRAIAECERQIPDVVLVDAMMPEMDGFEVVRTLRRMPDGGRPKILVMVFECDIATITRVLHAGADTYLMKPFTLDLVREKLIEVGILQAPQADAAA